MSREKTFHIGDTVVYPMHGIGRVKSIVKQIIEEQSQYFYQIVIEGQIGGEVLVPVTEANTLGLRFVLEAPEVKEVFKRLQIIPEKSLRPRQHTLNYAWCKERLRQGNALGLAEVRRFLHDLEQIESLREFKFRQLRNYVSTQLTAEIALALNCPENDAHGLVEEALTSKQPVQIPLVITHHEW